MEFTTLIAKLERFIRVINRAIIGLKLFEAFLVIVIGVATSFLVDATGGTRVPVLVVLVVAVVVYLLCLTVQIAYAASFPGSITEELKASKELERLHGDAERQRSLSEFLVQVMQQLNSQTCELGEYAENHLCSDGVANGVGKLLSPLTQNINVLLGTPTSNALVGIYLEHYRSLEHDDWVRSTIVLSDTLGARELIPSNLMESDDLISPHLDVFSAIRWSERNFEFHEALIRDENGRQLTMYCSPMPVACDEDSILGVLFILLPRKEDRVLDLPENMTIFGRVIANWVYRYNDCVLRRREGLMNGSALDLPRYKSVTISGRDA